MEQIIHNCNKCGVELNDETWYPSFQKQGSYVCKECAKERSRLHQKANQDKTTDFGGKVCRVCGIELTIDNWSLSYQKSVYYICKECNREKKRLYNIDNPEKTMARSARFRRKKGYLPMNENKECPQFLGIHVAEHDVAERLLRSIYKNVERMPINNPDYDFVCDGKKIDVKSGCIMKNRNGWVFIINRNTIADYFVCIAFDNREDLNLLHIWLIPGHTVNHLVGASIMQSTLHKWAEYEQDLSELIICCEEIKSE